MNTLELFFRGVAAGLIIAAPVGPVNIVVVQRTIAKGWRSGLVSGLGSAIVDTMYGSIAAFSITFVIRALVREEFWIRLVGGALLIAIGLVYYLKRPKSLEPEDEQPESTQAASTAILTATNPTTILSFLIVLSAVGLGGNKSWYLTVMAIGGIFAGSMLWWILLSAAVHRFRGRFGDRACVWMNRAAGLAIGAFGFVTMLMSRTSHAP